MELTVNVSDPEVVFELEKLPIGPERDLYARSALQLGVLSLRQARGELDSASIRDAGQSLISEFRELLVDRSTKISTEMASALETYSIQARVPCRTGSSHSSATRL